LLSQKKETKEKATPYRLFPDICIIMRRQAKTRYAQTVACRKLPIFMQISGAAAGEVKFKILKPKASNNKLILGFY